MFKQFLQQTCNIYSITLTTTGGEQTKTETKIYSNIFCKIYERKKFALNDSGLGKETNTQNYTIMLEGDKTNVNIGNIIEIIDGRGVNIGKFLVQSVGFYKNLNGKNDHLSLSVSKI